MSVEYNYYIALRDKNTHKFSLFPGSTYKCKKEDWYSAKEEDKEYVMRPRTIYWKSGSFVDRDFTGEFWKVNEADCDEEMVKAFTFKDWHDEDSFTDDLGYLTYEDLSNMNSEYIRRGYYLVEDVSRYEADDSALFNEDIFYDHVSPTVYTNMCLKQIKKHTEKDCEGYEYTVNGFEEYMYYAYPDYESKEYMIHELQTIMNSYQEGIDYLDEFKDKELILLQSIG